MYEETMDSQSKGARVKGHLNSTLKPLRVEQEKLGKG